MFQTGLNAQRFKGTRVIKSRNVFILVMPISPLNVEPKIAFVLFSRNKKSINMGNFVAHSLINQRLDGLLDELRVRDEFWLRMLDHL